MKKLSLFIVAICILCSCGFSIFEKQIKGNGNIVTKDVSIQDYSKLELQTSANLIYEQKESVAPFLSIEVDEDLQQYVSAEVVDGSLTIRTTKNFSSKRFNIYTNSKSLQGVRNSSSGNIELKGTVSSPNIELLAQSSGSIKASDINATAATITISGSGSSSINTINTANITLKLSGSGSFKADTINSSDETITVNGSGSVKINNSNSKNLNLSLSGSGGIQIGGTTTEASITASGSGSVNATALKATNAKCKSSGSGGINIQVTGSLDATTTGSGSIKYTGNPINVIKASNGSGKVIAAK